MAQSDNRSISLCGFLHSPFPSRVTYLCIFTVVILDYGAFEYGDTCGSDRQTESVGTRNKRMMRAMLLNQASVIESPTSAYRELHSCSIVGANPNHLHQVDTNYYLHTSNSGETTRP